jgi:hypothetical protein
VIRGPGWLGPRSAYSSARLRWMNGTERRDQCRAAIRISKSGEICHYFHCIFKFASSLGQSDTFSLAGYSDMKSKLVTFLRYDNKEPSLR